MAEIRRWKVVDIPGGEAFMERASDGPWCLHSDVSTLPPPEALSLLNELLARASKHDPNKGHSNAGKWVTLNAPRDLVDRCRALAAAASLRSSDAEPEAECRKTCDVCWGEHGQEWKCAKAAAKQMTKKEERK